MQRPSKFEKNKKKTEIDKKKPLLMHCRISERTKELLELSKHRNTPLEMKELPHKCAACARGFGTQHELKQHTKRCQTMKPTRFECEDCGAHYTQMHRLVSHRKGCEVAQKKIPAVIEDEDEDDEASRPAKRKRAPLAQLSSNIPRVATAIKPIIDYDKRPEGMSFWKGGSIASEERFCRWEGCDENKKYQTAQGVKAHYRDFHGWRFPPGKMGPKTQEERHRDGLMMKQLAKEAHDFLRRKK